MDFYKSLIELVRKNKGLNEIVNSSAMSSTLAAELTLFVTVLLSLLLLRHFNPILMVVAVIVILAVLLSNMPASIKFKDEQTDSIDRMIFHGMFVLSLLVVILYWGVNLG